MIEWTLPPRVRTGNPSGRRPFGFLLSIDDQNVTARGRSRAKRIAHPLHVFPTRATRVLRRHIYRCRCSHRDPTESHVEENIFARLPTPSFEDLTRRLRVTTVTPPYRSRSGGPYSALGSRTVTQVPFSFSVSIQISPFRASTRRFTIERPSPVPSYSRHSPSDSCLKALNI